VALGLIGVGVVWERRYRPVLDRLRNRLCIRAVYDPVPARAQLAATELHADVANGLFQLFERSDIQGVLVLDAAWQGLVPAVLACENRKPAFLAGSLGEDLESIQNLHQKSQETNVLLMTEFSRRHTPATNRLRELTATRLGGVRRISISAQLPTPEAGEALPGQSVPTDFLVGLLDWCIYLTGRVPAIVSGTRLGESAGWKVELGFRRSAHDPLSSMAEIIVQDGSAAADIVAPDHAVECEHGRATTSNPTSIAWENGSGTNSESLVSDRTDAEVMLDKFCRRVVGGVVPASDVLDVCRALALARAAEQSLKSGQPVPAPWDF